MPSHAYTNPGTFLKMAHRGASVRAPANTWPAFELAVQMGANVIETDVHWTKDRILVVSHDESVDSATETTGCIADMTYDELRRLDFGYQFTSDGGNSFPFRGKGISIPTFNELLDRWPTLRINVDLKPKVARVGSFLRIVADHGAFHRVLLASFHHKALLEARARCAFLATCASPVETLQFLFRYPELRSSLHAYKVPYVALQVPQYVWRHPLINANFVRRARELGVVVHVWTVNREEEMRRLIQLGVQGIVSDYPDDLVKVAEEMNLEVN